MATHPRSIEIDLDHRLGYIYYADPETKSARTVDVWRDGQIAADFDEAGDVIGIEILGLDDETLKRARAFAAERGLAFPANLAGNLVST